VSCQEPILPCLILLLNQRCFPPHWLQVPDCSTFRLLCDIRSTAVFSCEPIEGFPLTFSKSFFQAICDRVCYRYVQSFLVPHSMYLYTLTSGFTFFSDSFCVTYLFSGIVISISIILILCFRAS